jgi:hypothetical protein
MGDRAKKVVRTDVPPSDCGGAVRADVRLQRIIDLQEESSASPNALEACLGAVNGDLLLLERRLMQELDEFLNRPSESAEELMLAQSVFDQLLRITKNIAQYAQLGSRLRAARERAGT